MSEAERLRNFYPFDDDVLDRVERAAHRQEAISWPEYVRRFNIPEPNVYQPVEGKAIELVDFGPKETGKTMVYHQPMGCALDSNIMSHVATVADTHPDYRVIAVGNPGQPGKGFGKLSIRDSIQVWMDDFRPVVAPTLQYLESENITAAVHAGESYGADKAAASAEHANHYDSHAEKAIMVEPVSVVKSGLVKLGLTFQSTSQHADKYLAPVRERSQAFVSAEELRGSMIGYVLALGRLSNLAVGAGLGLQGFEGRVERALVANPDLKAGIAWGTASEFDKHNEREKITGRLSLAFPGRVARLPLEGQTHAMNLDIFLNAAIISQLLKETA